MTQTIISGRNNGYPCIAELPELDSIKTLEAPYPDMIMRVLGESVNDGYPCIIPLEGVEKRVYSELFFGDKQVCAMYCGEKPVEAAYCKGRKVFEVYYAAADTLTQS